MRCALRLLLCCLAGPAWAELSFEFPGASVQTFSEELPFHAYNLPLGPFADGEIPTLVAEGPFTRGVWRIKTANGSTLQVTDSLRQQLERMGFELLFECDTQRCGGFDFRFGTDVIAEPKMHVDLGDFRFLSAQRLGGARPEYLSLLVSGSSDFAYVQMTRIGFDAAGGLDLAASPETPAADRMASGLESGSIADKLLRTGSVALDDLIFRSGSADLGDTTFASLAEIAGFLKDRPGAGLALVGHTDAVGSLEANIALSRRRAQSVRARLVSQFGVPQGQVSADGVGYLAPRASNATEEGRARNRRVEAVLTTVE